VFIATYAGRVSSVALSSPLGPPLPPQNAPLPNDEIRRLRQFRNFGRRLEPRWIVGARALDQ
jgi:hypothetical protein